MHNQASQPGLGLCNKGFAKLAALVPLTKDQSPLWSSLLALVKALLKRSGFALCFAVPGTGIIGSLFKIVGKVQHIEGSCSC
jgi:hypothetical protein